MTRWIGLRWKPGNRWSQEVLIVRGLAHIHRFTLHSSLESKTLWLNDLHFSLLRSLSYEHIHTLVLILYTSAPKRNGSVGTGPHQHVAHGNFLGDDDAGVTPLPIPNRVVKPRCANGTASELVWESR